MIGGESRPERDVVEEMGGVRGVRRAAASLGVRGGGRERLEEEEEEEGEEEERLRDLALWGGEGNEKTIMRII